MTRQRRELVRNLNDFLHAPSLDRLFNALLIRHAVSGIGVLVIQKHRKTGQVVVISGVRRSGKSTLLRQFSLLYKDFLYINFDDDRLLDLADELLSARG